MGMDMTWMVVDQGMSADSARCVNNSPSLSQRRAQVHELLSICIGLDGGLLI